MAAVRCLVSWSQAKMSKYVQAAASTPGLGAVTRRRVRPGELMPASAGGCQRCRLGSSRRGQYRIRAHSTTTTTQTTTTTAIRQRVLTALRSVNIRLLYRWIHVVHD